MGLIDELAAETGYHPKAKAEEEYRSSSYNPFVSFPENLGHNLSSAGSSMSRGAKQLGEGSIGSGAFNVGLGALEGFYAPIQSGVQTVTQPAADVTGIPEWMLTAGAMLPLGYKSLGGAAKRLMGLGGEAAPAAEIAGAAGAAEPRIGATNREEWQRAYGERKQAYEEGVAGRRAAQMEEAAGRTPPIEPAERFFAEGPKQLPQFGKGQPTYRMPDESRAPIRESYAEGYKPGGPQLQLPAPPIYLPNQAKQWAKPEYESGIPMGGLPKWQAPQGKPSEEMMFGGRRMFPEQQLPDYSLGTFARTAAEQSSGYKGGIKEALSVPPETRPAKKIKRPMEVEPATAMSKEQKLQTVESEGVRSLYDAVRTLETSGMDAAEAEKHILNNIKAGHMTAVKANGSPLTPKEAKKLRTLSGLGGVSWIRG